MPKKANKGDSVRVKAKSVDVSNGGTVGVDRSIGKSISSVAESGMTSAAGFLKFALKESPIIGWGVGVGGLIAVVAIVSLFPMPPVVAVFGTIGVFVGMFGLWIFSALVKPPRTQTKPPIISLVVLWSFGLIVAGSGFLLASSLFFDAPVQLRSLIVPPVK